MLNPLRAVRPVKGDPWAGGAIGCADWTGASLADVLKAAGAAMINSFHVAFTSADTCQASDGGKSYGVSIPITKALQRDVLVAYAMNGEPLAAEHGFPLRIVVPGYAGVRSPKWLSAINVQDAPSNAHQQAADYKLYPPDMRPDTEELSRGITIDAMPLNSAISEPAPGTALKAGPAAIRGYAVATDRDITRVDLSSDGGRTWTRRRSKTMEQHVGGERSGTVPSSYCPANTSPALGPGTRPARPSRRFQTIPGTSRATSAPLGIAFASMSTNTGGGLECTSFGRTDGELS